jgi:hypothetical protein
MKDHRHALREQDAKDAILEMQRPNSHADAVLPVCLFEYLVFHEEDLSP